MSTYNDKYFLRFLVWVKTDTLESYPVIIWGLKCPKMLHCAYNVFSIILYHTYQQSYTYLQTYACWYQYTYKSINIAYPHIQQTHPETVALYDFGANPLFSPQASFSLPLQISCLSLSLSPFPKIKLNF